MRAYFPKGMWYSLWDHSSRIDASGGARHFRLHAPLGHIPIHIRWASAGLFSCGSLWDHSSRINFMVGPSMLECMPPLGWTLCRHQAGYILLAFETHEPVHSTQPVGLQQPH